MRYNHLDMLPEKAFSPVGKRMTLEGGGGGSKGSSSTSQTGIDPLLKPYIGYGLTEAQKLYQTDQPQYYAGQTYVSPSQATTQALTAAQNRALAGSPLLPAAQTQQADVISGKYLAPNPYFNQALGGATQAATQAYNDAVSKALGTSALAGRYGSNVSQDLTNRAATSFANTLANKYGELAFQNYATERGLQEAAATRAPALAEADYGDINKLLQVGQAQEDYEKTALQADIDRFNFEQNKPYAKLQTFLSSVYGAPQGSVTQTTQSGGGKIVCTAMNHVYGFGSFRQAIWLKHSANMHPAYEKGYHAIFLPVIMFAYKKNNNPLRKFVRKVAEHIARHRTADIWKQMRGGKRDTLGRIYRAVLEPICYVVGKLKGA